MGRPTDAQGRKRAILVALFLVDVVPILDLVVQQPPFVLPADIVLVRLKQGDIRSCSRSLEATINARVVVLGVVHGDGQVYVGEARVPGGSDEVGLAWDCVGRVSIPQL